MVEERQVWENKHKTDTKEQSWEITELKFKLRAEKIKRAELGAENQSVQNAIRAIKQSLREHKYYIIELQEDSVRQTIEYDRALAEAWKDMEDQKAQCLARQFYIKQTIEQIYKAIYKAHEMFDKAEALHQSFASIGRN